MVAVVGASLRGQDPAQPESKAMAAPALPFVDQGVCPFEGCAYRQWTARKAAVVYDTWAQKRRAMGRISAGDVVTGLTGVVVTFKPGRIRMDRDLPEEKLKRGDAILTYTYRGEGVSAVWFNGRFHPDFDISFTKWPDGSGCGGAHCAATYLDLGDKVWWAQVKPKSGPAGWVNMNQAQFDGIDLLALRLLSRDQQMVAEAQQRGLVLHRAAQSQ